MTATDRQLRADRWYELRETVELYGATAERVEVVTDFADLWQLRSQLADDVEIVSPEYEVTRQTVETVTREVTVWRQAGRRRWPVTETVTVLRAVIR